MANDMDTVQRLTKALTTVREHILDLLPGDAAGDDLKADLICLIDAAQKGGAAVSTHTPGPWQVEFGHTQQDSGIVYWQVHDGSDAIACNQFCAAGTEDKARLIAAAPDLLEALRTLSDLVFGVGLGDEPDVYSDYDRLCDLQRSSRAAIAKAEGRQ